MQATKEGMYSICDYSFTLAETLESDQAKEQQVHVHVVEPPN